MIRSLSVAAFCLMGGATVAQAAPATQAEADRLTGVMERYLGRPAPGGAAYVRVEPLGESYRFIFDFQAVANDVLQPFRASIASPFNLSLQPYTAIATPRADGLWSVSGVDYPTYELQAGDFAQKSTVKGAAWSGVFDPTIMAFSDYALRADSIDQEGRSADGTSRSHLDTITYAVQASGTADATDFAMTLDTGAATAEATIRPKSPSPLPNSFTLSYTVDSGRLTASGQGVRNAALLDLWRFAVEHHFTIGDQAPAFKALIQAALPGFDRIAERGEARNLRVATPVGVVSIDSLTASLEASGLVDGASGGIAFDMAGLTLPASLSGMPFVKLAPRRFTLDVGFKGFNYGIATRDLLEAVKLDAKPPVTAVQMAAIALEMIPSSGIIVTIGPTRYESPLFDIETEGQFQVGLGHPYGRLTFRAHHLDAAIAELEPLAKTNGQIGQTLAGLRTLQVMSHGTADGGEMWDLVLEQGGGYTLNGITLGTLGK